ncbi:peptidylprolyl isomerase [Lujinxingia litoralis]|uniref:Peptidyl-prolyl cis-trans isomerase n=1 Tax=Lujinxingia litoralis TaxID=2211119 RepID=A0A328C4X5_9DELT|nr:peptidylprolyl isomerase [Lujinxingia litoralis]RAL20930.1 peptidylprolyl isomerase [Lujinxingia litoralis]
MSDQNAVVADNKVVAFHYTLTNSEGEVLDTSEDNGPLAYLHGASNIVPGLEKQMTGKKVGDAFKAEVTPAEGYGETQGPGPQPVERSAFPPGAEIHEGMMFAAQMPDGSQMPLWVVEIEGDTIMVDNNHPLAGETLYFDVEITMIRDANAEEMAHGHPHGIDGNESHSH